MRPARIAVVLALALVSCDAGEPGADPPTDPTEAPIGTESVASSVSPEGNDTQAPSGVACWSSPPAEGEPGIAFSDETETLGLVAPLTGIYGHAAVWGDLTGDGLLDLFVGTFADRDIEDYQLRGATGPAPDRLLTRDGGGPFQILDGFEDMFTRTSGGVVVDLDNDGDLDLVLSRNWDDDNPAAPATQVMRNDGASFTAVPITTIPAEFGGRSVGVLDYNADGLMDLFITEDRWSGGRSTLLENRGDLSFEDVTAAAGIPPGVHGLGVAVADLNGDGAQDLLVTGSNRLFIATGDGSFAEADNTVFGWQIYDDEDDVAGVSVADVNRDGLLDVLIGQHFNSTVDDGRLVPVRLYLNRGTDAAGMPSFEDVTEAAGLVGLPTKAPHVEINDMDNDGWPDLVTTASAGEGTVPAIFRHNGLSGDVPTFSVPEGLGSAQYWVAGPTADVDRDGRLDLLLVEWEPGLPSLLLRNESASGNWLQVSMDPDRSFGIGWLVEVFEAGGLDEPEALLGARGITVTQGYSSGVAPTAHFGLGEVSTVDVRLTAPGGETHEIRGLEANQHARLPDGCG